MIALGDADLHALDRALDRLALEGDAGELRLLGAGEFTCVFEWRGVACKRLPPFSSRDRAHAYGRLIGDYITALRDAGMRVVDTISQVCPRADGTTTLYLLQPILQTDAMLPAVLRSRPHEAVQRFGQLLDHIQRSVSPGAGLDAQVTNWHVGAGGLTYFDVTTPLLRDGDGRDRLDVDAFLAVLPAVARTPARKFLARDLLDRFFNPRMIALDLAANLANCGLTPLTAAFVAQANDRLRLDLTEREILAYRRRERWTWALVRRALVAERFWQRHVHRRPHALILPSQFQKS